MAGPTLLWRSEHLVVRVDSSWQQRGRSVESSIMSGSADPALAAAQLFAAASKMMDLVEKVPGGVGGVAAAAAAGLATCYYCSRPTGPRPQDLVAPDGELAPEAIAALSELPEALEGVYSYDGASGAFKLEHSETGVPYDKTDKETLTANASLSLKAAGCVTPTAHSGLAASPSGACV